MYFLYTCVEFFVMCMFTFICYIKELRYSNKLINCVYHNFIICAFIRLRFNYLFSYSTTVN